MPKNTLQFAVNAYLQECNEQKNINENIKRAIILTKQSIIFVVVYLQVSRHDKNIQ